MRKQYEHIDPNDPETRKRLIEGARRAFGGDTTKFAVIDHKFLETFRRWLKRKWN